MLEEGKKTPGQKENAVAMLEPKFYAQQRMTCAQHKTKIGGNCGCYFRPCFCRKYATFIMQSLHLPQTELCLGAELMESHVFSTHHCSASQKVWLMKFQWAWLCKCCWIKLIEILPQMITFAFNSLQHITKDHLKTDRKYDKSIEIFCFVVFTLRSNFVRFAPGTLVKVPSLHSGLNVWLFFSG